MIGLKKVIVSLLGATLTFSAASGEPSVRAVGGEDEYFSDVPVVLSASRLPQSLHDAPGSMTVIDRETIKRTGARDLADIMRWVPGFQVAQATGGMTAPVMVYHGLWANSPNGLQIMVDGRTYYSPLWFGGVNFDALPLSLENIERIEVFRGSNSATFGSNAMAGVINIVTTDPDLARGNMVSASVGNQGVADVFVRTAGGDEAVRYRLSAARQQDHGLAWFHDSRRLLKFDGRVDWRLGRDDELRFMLSGVKTVLGIDYSMTGMNQFPDRNLRTLHFQTDWKHRLSGEDELSLRYFHVRESLSESFMADTGVPRALLDPMAAGNITLLYRLDPKVVRNDLELQHTVQLDPSKRLVWGFNWRKDTLESQEILSYPGEVSSTTKRLFAHLEWRLAKQWLLNAGTTWENESLSGTTVSPRLTLNYRPTEDQTFRIGAARSHRSPSIVEQRMRWLLNDPSMPNFNPLMVFYDANGNMKPERLNSLEIGYLGEFRSKGVTIDVRLFDERMKNREVDSSKTLAAGDCTLCAIPGMDSAATFRNVQDVRNQGVEYQLRWKTPWSSQIWFNQTFSHIKSQRFLVDLPADYANYVVQRTEHSMPRRSESIHWMQDLPWGGANLTVSYSHSTPMQWANTLFSTHRLDWRLAVPFKNGLGKGEVAWVARAANGPVYEYEKGSLRAQQQKIDPRHWITFSLEF